MGRTDVRPTRCRARNGFGLLDVCIGVFVISAGMVPLLWLTTQTRVDTSKAINYLRGLELAAEGIDWAQVYEFKDGTLPLKGSMREPDLDTLVAARSSSVAGRVGHGSVPVGSPKPTWQKSLEKNDIPYPDEYKAPYYFRQFLQEDLTCNGKIPKGFLKKVTVVVGWNEAKVPAVELLPERDRKLKMSILIFNDQNLDY